MNNPYLILIMSIDLWDIGKKKQRTLKKTDKIIKLIKNYKNKESELVNC